MVGQPTEDQKGSERCGRVHHHCYRNTGVVEAVLCSVHVKQRHGGTDRGESGDESEDRGYESETGPSSRACGIDYETGGVHQMRGLGSAKVELLENDNVLRLGRGAHLFSFFVPGRANGKAEPIT